jgi:hypothetical protein
VLALVFGEIDPVPRDPHRAERRFGRGLGRRHKREHRAVVRRIGLHVEQPDPRYRAQRRAQGVQDGRVTPLGKVWNTLNQR